MAFSPPTYPAYLVLTGHFLDVTSSQDFLGKNGRAAEVAGLKGSFPATSGYDGVWATQVALIDNAGAIGGGNGGSSGIDSPALENGADGGVGIVFAKGGDLNNTGGISVIYGGAGGNSTYGPGGAGGAGVVFDGSALSDVTNSGLILGGAGGNSTDGSGGAGGIGIVFSADGNLKNYSSISGGAGGSSDTGAGGAGGAGVVFDGSAVVTNYGSISGGYGRSGATHGGAGGTGITFNGTGLLTNASGSVIAGGNAGLDNFAGDGVFLRSGGSITDAGFIAGGSGGEDIFLKGGGGGPGGIGVDLANGGTLTVEQGGIVEGGAGGGAGGWGVDLANGGTLDVEQGGTVMGGASRGSGSTGGAGVYLNGGTLTTDGTIGGGTGVNQGDSVLFAASPATMIVGLGAQFDGAIGGFHFGDTVDITNLNPTYIESHFNSLTDTITTVDGTLQFAGDPHLIFSSNGDGGTDVTCACFRRGTLILTEQGERVVESLEIDDRVMTLSGEFKPIRWIGRRHYSGQALLDRPDVMPVLVRAGALGDHLPRRDMWVSPEHALYLNGSLTPAGLLTNGVSILTDDSVASVSYYHLEFESHEVVFAEGAPAESFVDDDSRQMFDNAADYARRYPDAPRRSATFRAPRVEDGEELEAVRVQLAEIASIPATTRAADLSVLSRVGL